MFLKRNKLNNTILILSSVLLLVLNLLTEFSDVFSIDSLLIIKSLLLIIIVFYVKSLINIDSKKINLFLLFWIVIFLINILFNLINVYSLGENQFAQQFCQLNSSFCQLTSLLFFKLKILLLLR